MSLAMSFNLMLLMVVIQKTVIKKYFYNIKISGLPIFFSSILSFLLLFFIPFAVINYILIFHNKKYERLLKKYPYYQGKLFLNYFIISMFLPVFLLWIGIVFFR